MTDLEKERELFEKWFIQQYGHESFVESDWKAWLASSNREGYKLVPIEPTEEMIDAARCRQWDDLSSPYEDMDMLKYKAMIGAAE